jgi:uncharacterized membrane protein YdjX (TVP38/TMEM64 family)
MYGVLWGTALYVISASAGAAIALLVGREFFAPLVLRFVNWTSGGTSGQDKVTAIGKAVANDGMKIVTLLRLSPAFPFVRRGCGQRCGVCY